MSASLVSQLRSKRPPITMAAGPEAVAFRVQVAELWDAVQVSASPDATVAEVKRRAVETFFPGHQYLEDFVLKLRGWEMLNESEPLRLAGVANGSILLLAYRRRRPVR